MAQGDRQRILREKMIEYIANGAQLGWLIDAGARTVELTSRPSREEANRLYAKLGFRLRETNVYRYEQRSSA